MAGRPPRPASLAAAPEDYIELRTRSAFSFLEGASNPEDLADRAAELELPALALCDTGGVSGIPRFHKAAALNGTQAIVGAHLELDDAASVIAAPVPGNPVSRASLQLLVETPSGWRRLSRLLTLGHADRPKGECRLSWSRLEEAMGGSEGDAGLVALLHADAHLRQASLERAIALFGRERVWVSAARSLEPSVERATRRGVALAEAAGVPVVAVGDVLCARRENRPLLDALTCLRHKTTLDAAGRLLPANGERFLRTRHEMVERFADRPEWVRETRAVAERCEFRLGNLGYRFPTFPTPNDESEMQYLRALTAQGARTRYGQRLPPRVHRQLARELDVIEKLDLAGYFLIVDDIARQARNRKMLAQGRGSAANSAVCYALGITAVDPVGMELLFERFLSEERGEWPDIDIDLPSGDQREEMIQYVFDRYGQRGAAMTANVITYRSRMAVREMGKVLGFGSDAIDKLSRVLSGFSFRDDLDQLEPTLEQAGIDVRAPRLERLLELVQRVQGMPRHLGQHSGGIVIAAGALDEVVPIEPASMEKRRIVQWDKDDCADLGIIKIDLLGLGMLAALESALPMIRDHEGREVDLAHLPADDPATYAMIQRADTVGTFQIESRAQMATLPRMKPRTFYDLVVEIAIIRPGPIVGQMVHPYLNRRAGREPVTYLHPSLEPILKRTLGVPLFQEQLLRIAMTVGGFSGGEAEELRRAMGFKRSVERMEKIEARLRKGMSEQGIDGDAQDEIVRGITSFALYGFPESHSASFALIAYASSYLKCHHPAAFLAGLLNAYPMGFYTPATLVKDAQRHGVEVRPIDVCHSHWHSTLESGREPERPAAPDGRPAVRLGLRYAHGLREPTGLAIEALRSVRPFQDLGDFTRRVAPQRDELDTLAELGALSGLGGAPQERRAALWQVAALERDPNSLFAGRAPGAPSSSAREPEAKPMKAAEAPEESPLPKMSPLERTLSDYRLSGMTTGPQLLAHLRPELRERGLLSARQLRTTPNGRYVRTAGHVIVRQRPGSAKGFCFLTLEDETGTSNAVLTPDQFQRFRAPLHTSSVIEIAGPIQNVDDVIHVRVRELVPLRRREGMPDGHDYR